MATVSGVSNMREAAMPQAKPASKPLSPQQKIANLFQQIDTAGTGRITKAQFEQAFEKINPPAAVKAMGVQAAFSKLDPSGTGSVSKQDFIKGMEALMEPPKVAAAQATPAQAPKAQASSVAPPAVAASAPAPVASGPIGNTINITA
jgi:Ca2+-binding EF-hand superfamily protein